MRASRDQRNRTLHGTVVQGWRCEVESEFCVPDRPTQKMRFLRFRLGKHRPTDRRAKRGEENFGSELGWIIVYIRLTLHTTKNISSCREQLGNLYCTERHRPTRAVRASRPSERAHFSKSIAQRNNEKKTFGVIDGRRPCASTFFSSTRTALRHLISAAASSFRRHRLQSRIY